jgi:hypothetical protein
MVTAIISAVAALGAGAFSYFGQKSQASAARSAAIAESMKVTAQSGLKSESGGRGAVYLLVGGGMLLLSVFAMKK